MKQHSTKILVSILVFLVAAFVLTKVFRSPARESNLDGEALKVDTARVSEIRLAMGTADSSAIRLVRQRDEWQAAKGSLMVEADGHAVRNLLRTLSNLSFERIVTRSEEKWNTYGVGDSASLRVEVYGSGNEIARMVIGEERSGKTYVRQEGDHEVFVVDGTIRSAFGREFNDFRNRAFLRVEKSPVTQLTFTYPADSGFVVKKEGGAWMLENAPADSARTERYLSSLGVKNLSVFADGFSPVRDPDMAILIESDSAVFENIQAWLQPDSTWRLHSMLREDVYFSAQGSTIIDDLFKGRQYFE